MTELIGWLLIVVSLLAISLALAAFIYFSYPTTVTFIVGLLICIAGLVTGMVVATRMFRSKRGTLWLLSRTTATPDIDESVSKEQE